MTTTRLAGVLAPVITPFARDLHPDPARFVSNALSPAQVHSVRILADGTTAEKTHPATTVAETRPRLRVMRICHSPSTCPPRVTASRPSHDHQYCGRRLVTQPPRGLTINDL